MIGDPHGRAGGDARDARGTRSGPPPPVPPGTGPPSDDTAPDTDPTFVSFVQEIDGTWLYWSVAEVDAHAVPGALGARCLVFSRQDCIRRVWRYPANWRDLDDAGLAALSWQR